MNGPGKTGRRAVFLDRDGTLMEDAGYASRPDQVRLYPGTVDALKRLSQAGFGLVLVTNQSGIGRGYFTEADFHNVQAEVARQLRPVKLAGVYFCPDHPDQAGPRRKPAPGMLLEAARDLDLDLAGSFMIGDKEIDVGCGQRAGARAVLLDRQGTVERTGADFVAGNLETAVDWILDRSGEAPAC